MAAAFFNALADPARARAISAGTAPAARVNPDAVAAMRDAGISLDQAVPQKLTLELAAGVQWLITMGCGDECPVVAGTRRDDWPLDDPKGRTVADVRVIREQIRDRVVRLIHEQRWSSDK